MAETGLSPMAAMRSGSWLCGKAMVAAVLYQLSQSRTSIKPGVSWYELGLG